MNPGRGDTIAMVTGGKVEKLDVLRRLVTRTAKNLGVGTEAVRGDSTGGNPKLFPLVALDLDVLVEPWPVKPYDAALLHVLVATPGVQVINLATWEDMTTDEVNLAFHTWVTAGGDNTVRSMPPYLATTNVRLGAAVLKALRQLGFSAAR